MSEAERSSFVSKEVARAIAHKNSRRNMSTPSTPAVSENPLQNPCRSRQSYGRALNESHLELPHSTRKKRDVVLGLVKVGLFMWNEYDKMTCGNVGLSNEFKKESESFFL